MNHLHFTTPVGTLLLTWTSQGSIARVDWLPLSGPLPQNLDVLPGLPSPARSLLEGIRRYFMTGEPLEDGSEPSSPLVQAIDVSHWSEFQKKVYGAVMQIPHGETRTYAWVASKIGQRGAGRAVGQALRRNQHLIVVPCHRVVSSHDIGGFMGADDPSAPELQFKQRLLAWENSWRNPMFSFLTA